MRGKNPEGYEDEAQWEGGCVAIRSHASPPRQGKPGHLPGGRDRFPAARAGHVRATRLRLAPERVRPRATADRQGRVPSNGGSQLMPDPGRRRASRPGRLGAQRSFVVETAIPKGYELQ